MRKKILETSDPRSTSRLSHWPSEPTYYIVDCRISYLVFPSCFVQLGGKMLTTASSSKILKAGQPAFKYSGRIRSLTLNNHDFDI